MDEDEIKKIKQAISEIFERITAMEREQRQLKEDILSGIPKERMQKRLLENPKEKFSDKKEKINDKIKIEI